MTYDAIRNLIKDKKPDMDMESLKLFSNYFLVVVKKNLIPKGVTLESLIDNAFTFAGKIEFYDENHIIYIVHGEM